MLKVEYTIVHMTKILLVQSSDVARPLSYKAKTTYFFKTKTAFFKDYQIIHPRPLT